jgi:hypothetical protein
MNSDNKAMFVFGFIFYFIGDLVTTYIALYLLIVFLEKRNNNYLCGAVLGLVAGMGMTVTWMNALVIMEYLR